jgi:predicted dehydrogenase
VSKIRVGIVGAGSNTRDKHLPNLAAIDDVQVVAVCNRSRESAQRVAQEFDIPRIYEHWSDLVGAPDIDAVLVATWPNTHSRITVAALGAGKHVLCESRMSTTVADARAMLEAAHARPDLVAQLVPAPATLPVDATVRRLLSEGYVGDVLALDVRFGGAFVDRVTPSSWRQNADIVGVNIMLLGVWFECVTRWVGDAITVTAQGTVAVKMRPDESGRLRGISVPDHIDVLASMACGAQAHFQFSAISGLAPTEAFVFGSEGTLRFSGGELSGAKRGADSLTRLEIPASEVGHWRVEEEFINAIRGIEAVKLTTFEDGVKNMAFNEAVARSMQERRTVNLPLFS